MFSEAKIYQRTVKGHAEIQDKTHELNQGERLILVMVNAVTPYWDLGSQQKSMGNGRLNRALLNLLKRGLIAKTDGLPLKQGAEKFDPRAAKRFLQRHPLDPVTATPLELLAEWVVTVPAGAFARPAGDAPNGKSRLLFAARTGGARCFQGEAGTDDRGAFAYGADPRCGRPTRNIRRQATACGAQQARTAPILAVLRRLEHFLVMG